MELQELPRNDSSPCLGEDTMIEITSSSHMEAERNRRSEEIVIQQKTYKKCAIGGIFILLILGLIFAVFVNFKCEWIGCTDVQSAKFSSESFDYEYDDWKYWKDECKGLKGLRLTSCEYNKYEFNCRHQITRLDVGKICNKQNEENKHYILKFVYVPRCPGKCSSCPKGKVCRPISEGKKWENRTVTFKNKGHVENKVVEVEVHDKCSCQEETKKEYKPHFKCL